MMPWPTIYIGVLSELNRSKHWRVSIQYAHANFDLHMQTLACNSFSRGHHLLDEVRIYVDSVIVLESACSVSETELRID